MKKIICIVTNDLNYDQRMIRICSTLSEAGYQVQLVGRLRSNSQPLATRIFEQKRLRCYFERGVLFYTEYNIRLFIYLLITKCDIICAVDLDTILPGWLAARCRRRYCVYDAHEYFTETPELVRRPHIQRVWAFIAKVVVPRVDVAYTVGACLSEILAQRYQISFGVVRNVPFRQTSLAQPNSQLPPVLLYQGALNEGRGLEQVLAAMPYIPDALLWLAGEGDLSDALRQMVQSAGLEQRVHFWGYLRPEALRELTLQATIGLNLLENNGLNYYYSLANKAFDYIQVALPSLQMNFPEYQRIQAQYEVFVLLDDLQSQTIAASIQNLLKDKDLYKHLRQNCLLAREALTWENEQQILLQFYKNIHRP
ncbi:MAG TPA: glycosyltransferase family 4 protein [Saprospiraceae bacterium]|nr:glycosyltransferase family 4 protein [Saprospiraceae bacterium]HMP12814.1 glycosyltransferase family 4 protein [Saprospiraceae bacterium]